MTILRMMGRRMRGLLTRPETTLTVTVIPQLPNREQMKLMEDL